MDRAVTPVFLF